MMEGQIRHCIHEGRISMLEANLTHCQNNQKRFTEITERINDQISDINEKWGHRPSWATSIILTTLSSILSALIIYTIMGV